MLFFGQLSCIVMAMIYFSETCGIYTTNITIIHVHDRVGRGEGARQLHIL